MSRRGRAGALALLAALAGCGSDERAPVATAPGTVVWAVGDGAASGPAAARVTDRIAREGVDRLLYLGDVYDHGTAADFARWYDPTYGRFARVTTPTPGNHEWPTRRQGYDPYWTRVHGERPASYSSFELAGWEIIRLNSESRHDARSPQLRWLRRALREPGDCRIAFWHRPRYNAGTVHGDAPDVQPFWAALRGRARIVLGGHEHNMQRFRPRDGITQFVSGAGGRELYGLRKHPGLAFGDTRHFGALRLSLRPGRADHAFVSAGGATLDAGSIRCSES